MEFEQMNVDVYTRYLFLHWIKPTAQNVVGK